MMLRLLAFCVTVVVFLFGFCDVVAEFAVSPAGVLFRLVLSYALVFLESCGVCSLFSWG